MRRLRRNLTDQHAESLVLALMALALGTLLVSPLLAHLGASLRATETAEASLHGQYSTDAGAEYTLWKIANDAAFRQTLIADQGTPHSVPLSLSVNGEIPTVQAVCVMTETATGGSSSLEWAIWAGSETADDTVKISGAGHTVQGGVHSNHKIKVSGPGHKFYGIVEYVTSYTEAGWTPFFDPDEDNPRPTTAQPFPITWEMADFESGGSYATAAQAEGRYTEHDDWTVSGAGTVVPEGLHYCTGDVDFSGAGLVAHNVTVVARGNITVSGAGLVFAPYVPGLTFFTDKSSTSDVVSLSGAGNVGGTTYAPNGKISLSGAGGIVHCAFLGDVVEISGSVATVILPDIPIPSDCTCGIFDIRSTSGSTTTTVRMKWCDNGDLDVLSWHVG